MFRVSSVLLCVAVLGGCATAPRQGYPLDIANLPPPVDRECAGQLPPELAMQLDMIERMLSSQRPRAALAYLQSIAKDAQERPQVLYLSAEAYRRIGQTGLAAELYGELLDSCLAGYAYHGLGLSSARQSNAGAAVDYLARAVALVPTDADVRNDFGFALLEQGRVDAAAEQFATAVELRVDHARARQNLVLVRLLQNRDEEAVELARQFQLTPAVYRDLELEALRRLNPSLPQSTESPAASEEQS